MYNVILSILTQSTRFLDMLATCLNRYSTFTVEQATQVFLQPQCVPHRKHCLSHENKSWQ